MSIKNNYKSVRKPRPVYGSVSGYFENVISKPKKSSRSEEVLIKTLKTRVKELEEENIRLRNQIQKLYGDLYIRE